MSVNIYYDGDCPFCARYVRFLRLRDSVGTPELVDVREHAAKRQELQSAGFDLDQGMVVDMDGRQIGGADAVNALAMMSTRFGLFNRMNRMLFSSPAASQVVYPVLRSGRWITLFLMGRDGIESDAAGDARRQVLFSFFFALFSLFHVFNYAFAYDRFPPSPDLMAVFGAAILVLLRPQSPRMLFLLMLASLISTIAQAPAQSNHTMLRTAVLIGYWLSFGYAWVRAMPISQVFENFVLAGRGSLLVMYVFGIFHKINTDFLNPETSCAVRLWQDMPFPLNAAQGPVMDFLAIYGTFAVEGVIMLALLYRPTRYLGLVIGICFHLLLSLSDYAAYTAFTTLSIALHVLFLSKTNALAIAESREMAAIRSRAKQPIYVLSFVLLLLGGAVAMYARNFSLTNLTLWPLILPLCYLILRYGAERPEEAPDRFARPAYVFAIVAAGLYFFSGAMPYMGLKTAQSINMFANLRLEAGVSNHLVFPNPPGLFTYLDDVATITDTDGSRFLRRYEALEWGIIYYDLVGHLADNPHLSVSYEMNGQSFADVSAADVQSDIDGMLHAPFVRKWFHFQPVQLQVPEYCTQ